jgi:DNA polymerase
VPAHLTLDFEVRSPLDVKKVGPYRYFEHPDTRPLMVSAIMGDKAGVFFDLANMPSWVLDALANDDVEIHAHNATFERLCIREVCGPKYGWPVPKGRRYRCSAARARRLAFPGKLEKLGPVLGLNDNDLKDAEGHKVMLRIVKPRATRKGEAPGVYYDDDPAKLERVGAYCLQDAHAEEMAESRMLPMEATDWDEYHFTERLNDRGVRIDTKLVKRLVWRAVQAADELDRQIRDLTDGMVPNVSNVGAIKKWVYQETGVVLETLRKEDMDGLVGEGVDMLGDPVISKLPKYVVRVLKLRQEGGKSSNSKLLKILDRVSADGRLRGEFVFHGASTGRYTSMGVQLQNLIRDCLKDFDKEIQDLDKFTLTQITLAIRGCFIPAEGHVFVDADYNAIEARGVAWLAGCEKLVQMFRDGVDTYCAMGGVIYRRTITEADVWERFVGKQTILGCGYGMGAQKFEDQCIKFGKPVGMETAELAVRSYREEYWEIPVLWRNMERAAIDAVENPGETFAIPNGLIKFRVAHGYLQMRLPSGRRLFYKDARVMRKMKFGKMQKVLSFMGVHPKTKQWAREFTWGGTLVENAVQALSRDILFRAMLTLDRMGVPIVLSVHDQVIAEVLKEDGEWAVRQVKRVMEKVPGWARGFPIKTKPNLVMRFGK